MKPPETIGIVFNSRVPEAQTMSEALVERLNLESRSWIRAADELESDPPPADQTDLILTVGGDGTILRTAAVAVPYGVPILGINMGRLGFMTELEAEEALDRVPHYMEGAARVEERSMFQVHLVSGAARESAGNGGGYRALNDAVVGRGAISRLVRVKAVINGAHLTDFRADAIMVCTASGSTGYNLSVGGPILPPESGDMIVKSVAPHVGMAPALVLPADSTVELTVDSDYEAILSVDGYIDVQLAWGDSVRVEKSPYKAAFLRANPPEDFYATLTQRLGFGGGQSTTRAIQY